MGYLCEYCAKPIDAEEYLTLSDTEECGDIGEDNDVYIVHKDCKHLYDSVVIGETETLYLVREISK